MRPVANLLWMLFINVTLAQSTNSIREMTLDPHLALRIPVAQDRLTTIRFPTPPSDLEGLFLAPEPDPSALFQISFRAGNPFFSVRALVTNAIGNLNVVWKQQTYVLELFHSPQPLLSVILKEPRLAPPASTSSVPVKIRVPDAARIRELLALAESLRQDRPPYSVLGIERSQPNLLWTYLHHDVWLHDIFRFNQDDTLVFCATLRNKSGWDLAYRPEALAATIGTATLVQSGAKADGFVRVGEEDLILFAVTGSLNGAPANLSVTNQFGVLTGMIKLHTPPPPPAPRRSWLRRLFHL